jgi:2,4-diketo-3-deoxy-L-fuconate hydrolase
MIVRDRLALWMSADALASILDAQGATAALVDGDTVRPLPGRPTMLEVLNDWPDWSARLSRLEGSGPELSLGDVRLLAPVPNPPNLYMVGANYPEHVAEMGDGVASRPQSGPFVFLRPTTSLMGDGDAVVLPPGSEKVDWEAELAVLIGRRAHEVSPAAALEHVAGYAVANDVSVRDRFQRGGERPPMTWDWFRQKGWWATCPCGPYLVPAERVRDPDDLAISLKLNGRQEQSARTSQMIFSVAEVIASISAVVPLVPGDVVCTGTPSGVGMGKGRFLAPGDVMEAEVEGVGRLRNQVVAAADARDRPPSARAAGALRCRA